MAIERAAEMSLSDTSMIASLQVAIDFVDGRKSITKAERVLLIIHLQEIIQRIVKAQTPPAQPSSPKGQAVP